MRSFCLLILVASLLFGCNRAEPPVQVRVEATGSGQAQLAFSPSIRSSEWSDYELPFVLDAEVSPDQVVAIYGRGDKGLVLSVYVEGELVKQDPTGTAAQVGLRKYFQEKNE